MNKHYSNAAVFSRRATWRRLIGSILAFGACVGWFGLQQIVGQSLAQRVDSYEGGGPRWQLVESDCQAQLVEHEISLNLPPHLGRASELFQVACGVGQNVWLAYPIEPCLALNEFQPRLWVRCSSGGLRLGVRVIFPFAEHPVTQGRLNSILWGDVYEHAGEWQVLRVTELERLLQEEIVALRQKLGGTLNLDGAFIDSLVLNAYTGPGRYRVQVDDLELDGMVPLAALGRPLERDWRDRWRWRHAVPDPELRFWSTANRPPLWLQYRDEPPAWLRSLGFSGVFLDRLPEEKQLTRVSQAGLDIIAPPPAYELELNDESNRAIKGWFVGAALDAGQADVAQAQVQQVLSLSPQLQRPLIGEALEHYWMFSRMTDEVIVPTPGPVLAGTARDKLDWLTRQLLITRQRGHGWVSIHVGEPPAIEEQYRAALRAIGESEPRIVHDSVVDVEISSGSSSVANVPSNPFALRHQAVTAILAGARGVVLRTSSPLDIHGMGDRATVAAIRAINNDLDLWGPWLMAGQSSRPPQLSRNDYAARSWSIGDSQLIIAACMSPDAERCQPTTRNRSLNIDLSAGRARQVVRITLGQLSPLQTGDVPGMSSFAVEQPEPVEVFIVSESPRVLEFVRGKLNSSLTQRASDQLEMTEHNLRIAASIVAARFSSLRFDETQATLLRNENARLANLQRLIDGAWQALRSDQPSRALEMSLEASHGVQAILQESMSLAATTLASPQSSPFVLTPAMLPLHWKLAAACERSNWSVLPLPGGELTNLQELMGSWWQKRRIEDQVDLRVEVVPRTEQQSGGLRLAAYQRPGVATDEPMPGGYQGASLLIRSAAVPVRSGQLVRVTAMANVVRTGESPDSGLLVYDNQAGPALGQLVRGVQGARSKVELYRMATSDGEFRILAECRGECDVVLESLLVEAITPATNNTAFPLAPVGATYGELELKPLAP